MLAMAEKNRLQEILDRRGISKYKLAKDTGLTYQTILAVVNADEIPDKTWYATLKTIADYLGVTIDDLAGED